MIQLDRLIRNLVLLVGLLMIIGGAAAKSVPAAVMIAGGFMAGAALLGMWLTRGR